jgi:hypothetical protein
MDKPPAIYKYDKIMYGMIAALICSIVFFFLITWFNDAFKGEYFFDKRFGGVREQFIYILSIVSNLIPFQVFSRKRMNFALRGVGVITILEAMGLVIYFYSTNKLG